MTDQNDNRRSGSGSGAELDVMAPSWVYATDIMGSAGKVSGDYIENDFRGTSAAAPHVSGLAGLILSVDNSFTEQQVRDIIQYTADDKGSEGWDQDYGWGRINAKNAVKSAARQFTTSGQLAHNECWWGTVTLTNNVTVPSGIRLTVLSDATIKIPDSKNITVNGTLNAIGTSSSRITFTRSSSSEDWSGIRYQSGSGGQLKYCNIERTYNTGVNCYYSSPSIINCKFKYNFHGIAGYYNQGNKHMIVDNEFFEEDYAGIYLYQHKAYIDGNKIDGNGESNVGIIVRNIYQPEYVAIWENDIMNCDKGIYLDDGSAEIQKNDIYDNSYGIYATDESYPYLLEWDEDGENVIADNNYGLYIDSDSEANLHYGWNTICDNTYKDVACYNQYTTIWAEENYWGSDDPSSSQFYGNVYYYYWLDEDETGRYPYGFRKPVSNTDPQLLIDSSISNENSPNLVKRYNEALRLEHDKNYEEAALIYTEIIDQYPDNSLAVSSIRHLMLCYKKLQKSNFIFPELQKISQKHNNKKVSGKALKYSIPFYIESGQYNEAISICKNISNKFSREKLGRDALYEEWVIYFQLLRDEEAARSVSADYEKSYGVDDDLIFMKLALGDISTETAKEMRKQLQKKNEESPPVVSEEQQIPESYELLGNYPNPFNPTTTVPFDLPEASIVKITIYDLTGRRVALLADGSYHAGSHTLTFDGSRLPTGVYFIRAKLTPVENQKNAHRFTRKMMLIK